MSKRKDEFENLIERIEDLSSKLSVLSSGIEELKKVNSKTESKFKETNRQLFWAGAMLGIVGGILGGLYNSYLMKLYDFQNVPYYAWVLSTIFVASLVGIFLFLMWKLAFNKTLNKSNRDNK